MNDRRANLNCAPVGAAIAAALAITILAPANAQITRIVAFGDSMTDTGNWFDASGGISPPSPPNWEGRFSNGPVWVEHLADSIGVPRPAPIQLGGPNAAFGGAPTGSGTFIDTTGEGTDIEIPRVGTQIDELLSTHTLSEGDLVVVWAGFNDLRANLPGGPLPPQQIVDNLTDHITTLHEAGATTFLLANLHNGGSAHLSFNSLWQSRVREMRQGLAADLYFLDFASLVRDVFSRLGDFGFNGDTAPIIDRPVDDPDQYTNWDGIHVTTAFHRIIAERALEEFRHVEGDFNDNGIVEQADLDMVLSNWGQRVSGRLLFMAGWINDLPARPYIDQEELDRVLLNWGKERLVPATLRGTQGIGDSAVPEPSSLLLFIFLFCAARGGWLIRHPTRRMTVSDRNVPLST